MSAGTGVTFRWYTGAEINTGTSRTLARGAVLTITKRGASNTYDIWGIGIS